jgi:hypothetical protein
MDLAHIDDQIRELSAYDDSSVRRHVSVNVFLQANNLRRAFLFEPADANQNRGAVIDLIRKLLPNKKYEWQDKRLLITRPDETLAKDQLVRLLDFGCDDPNFDDLFVRRRSYELVADVNGKSWSIKTFVCSQFDPDARWLKHAKQKYEALGWRMRWVIEDIRPHGAMQRWLQSGAPSKDFPDVIDKDQLDEMRGMGYVQTAGLLLGDLKDIRKHRLVLIAMLVHYHDAPVSALYPLSPEEAEEVEERTIAFEMEMMENLY